MRPKMWPWMLAYMVLRSALLLTVEAPETRYTLECFPMLFVLDGIALYRSTNWVLLSVLKVKASEGRGWLILSWRRSRIRDWPWPSSKNCLMHTPRAGSIQMVIFGKSLSTSGSLATRSSFSVFTPLTVSVPAYLTSNFCCRSLPLAPKPSAR